MNEERSITLLCLASEFKGLPFIEEAKRLGSQVLLVVKEAVANKAWPQEMIDGFYRMPDLYTQPDITYAVSYLARSHKIDSIVALDDYLLPFFKGEYAINPLQGTYTSKAIAEGLANSQNFTKFLNR